MKKPMRTITQLEQIIDKQKENLDVGNIVLAREIEAHKETARALKKTEQLLNSTIDHSPIGIALVRPDGYFFRVNPAFCQMVGRREEDLKKMNFQDITHPDDYKIGSKVLADLISGKIKSCAIEKRYLHKNVNIIDVHITVAMIKDDKGEPLYIFSQIQDITEQKKAQTALRDHSRQLEQKVKERTREIEEIQNTLIRKEKLLVLGQLAGGVGHELRNPLSAIKNAVYLLNMIVLPDDPDVIEAMSILDREVLSAEKIIESLFSYANPRQPVREKINVHRIIREIADHLPIPDAVDLVLNLHAEHPRVLGDGEKLLQVFRNLIRNAIQAMPDGGLIEVLTQDGEHQQMDIRVIDHGTGILKEHLDSIFEPLFSTKAKGIGLGLSLSKDHVEAHGGTIKVDSHKGSGTEFCISLPAFENAVK